MSTSNTSFLFLIGLALAMFVGYADGGGSNDNRDELNAFVAANRERREEGLKTCKPTVSVQYQRRECTESRSKKKRIGVKTGGWWWTHVKYKYVREYYKVYVCCSGYRTSSFWNAVSTSWSTSQPCKPMCHESADTYSCNRNEGRVEYKTGDVVTCSGGGCVEPNICDRCNDGYYNDNTDGYCKACVSIPHCLHARCSSSHDSACVFCEQEVGPKPGYQVYSHTVDDRTCKRMCSWRKESRCYPGICQGNMVYPDNCKCADGFDNGSDCATFLDSAKDKLKITVIEVVLGGDSGPPLIAPDPLHPDVKVWTNRVDWSRLNLTVKTSVPGVAPPDTNFQSYLNSTKTKVGIDTVVMTATFRRGSSYKDWKETRDCHFDINCNLDFINKQFVSIVWNNILQGRDLLHRDSMAIITELTSGGRVYYYNRDNSYKLGVNERLEYYQINGKSVHRTTEIQVDLYPPAHCLEDSVPCNKETIYIDDFVNKFPIPVHWDGWMDEDSGLFQYHLDVYKLEAAGGSDSQLTSTNSIAFQTVVNATELSTSINVTTPGPYFVEIIAVDKAENYKSSRRVFMYDDASVVDMLGNSCVVTTADSSTNHKWINQDADYIELVWPGRFINKRHHNNHWLNEVAMMHDIAKELDDTSDHSARNLTAIHNIRGVVKNMVSYNISFGKSLPVISKPFIDVPRDLFDQEKMIVYEDLVDGKQLTFTVRGYDVMGKYAEDNTTVNIDLSPPAMQNMWLTKGDILNISVHSAEELNKLTIEWEAFDVHSGLQQISWRIFDNYTKTEILHGASHEPPQGEAKTIDECRNKYKDHARGAKCYCTPFHGCFHKHYQIKPRVVLTGSDGLVPDKQNGLHESDYFIEVTAVNIARLKTVSVMKITIDTSPPHEGSVHDGLDGQPEVDFQQTLSLNAHWDGFFDKESAVWFYMYGFGNSCLPIAEFDVSDEDALAKSRLQKTYSTSAHITAPAEGTYHVTVAAYNHAYDHSHPVCSDGVTIENVPARVNELVVKGAVAREGLLKDNSGRIWVLYKTRIKEEILTPSSECITRATQLSDEKIDMFPTRRTFNGTESRILSSGICSVLGGVHHHMMAFVTSNTHLDLSWNVSGSANIHDFEVGLSSDNSSLDKMDFVSSRQHQHIKIINPNIWDGEEFFIIIRTITKSAITHDTIAGPFAVDTTKPEFSGTIEVQSEQSAGMHHLVVRWSHDAFEDHGDPAPLHFQVAIGSKPMQHDVLSFQRLSPGCSCKLPVTCTAINIDRLNWHLHGHRSYYVTVKASNTVGMFTLASSDEYIHDVELPSVGVVFDVSVQSNFLLQDIEDIDFQTDTDKLSARWSGFHHPHVDISYVVCVHGSNSSTPLVCRSTIDTELTFTSLNLQPFLTYYQTVTAVTEAGNVSVKSDGVTVFKEGQDLQHVSIFDGPPCDSRQLDDAIDVNTSHHTEDKRLPCIQELDFQASTNDLHVRWELGASVSRFSPDVYWALEQRAPVTDIWQTVKDYEHIKTANHIKVSGLTLMAGRKYRVALKFCAVEFCFKPATSNGVTILANPPSTGDITTVYNKHMKSIQIDFDTFFDPDIEDTSEAMETVDHYEWALTDNDHHGRLMTRWKRVNVSHGINTNQASFVIHVDGNITSTKCWRVSLRGYNKAGLSSVVSSEVRNCSDINKVKPHTVIDAVGRPVYSSGTGIIHEGQHIQLDNNNYWTEADRDYSPYSNIISAVWPSLRYPEYSWAILEVKKEDATVFYGADVIDLVDPCQHPDAISCGKTDKEFINANFETTKLQHGARYMVCIHSNATSVHYEKWTMELDELDACSDGITIDLTPPTPASAWIGQNIDDKYQSSTSCITVNWKSFIDVEEEGHSVHISGVSKYRVAVGSSHGGVDIVEFTDVGLTNHHMFHGLQLQNGHSYFATVEAEDFTGQTARSWSRSIKVDSSPPQLSGQSIQLTGRHITDISEVSACWKGVFIDIESGISHYEWSIGSQRGYDNIMAYTRTEMECGESDSSVSLSLVEGHAYFVSVKAYNYAGHYTLAISWAFTVDASPPKKGHVFDGSRPGGGTYHDIDYTISTSVIAAHWTEFYEPHGSLKEYHVHVGSCLECDDILSHQPVGLTTDIHLTGLKLSEGQRYYVTVTACNTADMCTMTSSDGVVVDKSPPIPGRVQDGVEGRDVQYQASRIYLGAQWFGFNDAQSDISHFVWRAGTLPGMDDVLSATSVIRAEEAFVVDLMEDTGRQLPVGQTIYISVRAYNKAGMFSEAMSNGFIVDVSGPVFGKNVTHHRIGSAVVNTSVLQSVLRVEWEVADNESFIDEQYLSIVSHIGGDFNASSIKVDGIVRDYTFSDLDLHDGSVYCVTLVSCNGAQLCSETQVQHLLVDSSPPTPGMFAINTDHAAALDREPDTWMTWSVLKVKLAWLGFQDVHSDIDRYLLNVGSTFMGNDLHKMSSDPHVVYHDDSGNLTDEGTIQVQEIWTKPMSQFRSIFVSMWAINGVGLSSPIIHHEFELVDGGDLELVRRCDAHTCLGHCVCAPHGELCHTDKLCADLTNVTATPDMNVDDMLDLTFHPEDSPVLFSPTRTLTAARWTTVSNTDMLPLWYEWSIGESRYANPKGVFDITSERVWYDAGQNVSWIFSHQRGHFLKEKTKYSFFVRAWFDKNSYAVYKSSGVIVYSTPPATVKLQGKMVKELTSGKDRDVDFITVNMPVFVDWADRYSNTHDSLLKYHLYISTYPGGHDAYCVAMSIPATQTRYNITGLKLMEDTKYYSVVQVYNKAGYHRTEWSDGFFVDNKPPAAGIVHDGEVFKDIHALNSSRHVPSFWYGFIDTDAGISSYNVCVSTQSGRHCNVHPEENVGMNTHAYLSLKEDMADGSVLRSEVQATDCVGYKSPWVKSNGVVIDSSSPVRSSNYNYGANMVMNPSFEVDVKEHTMDDIVNSMSCTQEQILGWNVANDGCSMVTKSSESHGTPDGLHYIILVGAMYQDITNLTSGAKYRLTFFTSHVPSDKSMLSNCEGFIQIDNKKYGFLLYNKPALSHDKESVELSPSWHKHTYYFHATQTSTRLTISTMGTTKHIAVDMLSLEEREGEKEGNLAEQQGHIKAHTVFIHDWSSIHAEWNFVEEESEIDEYVWAIGTVEGGTQLQPFVSVGKRTFAFTSSLHLVHDTTVYVTVVAVNAASLRTVSYSDPILIDLTPPYIRGVYDGDIRGEDIDYQKGYTVSVNWDVTDKESQIQLCEWAIDTGAGDIRIQNFSVVQRGVFNATTDVPRSDLVDDMIYVSVRCTNKAGLTSHMTTDGVRILTLPPSTDGVLLEVLGASLTQYPVKDGYHGNNNSVIFRWIGFEMDSGINNYLVAVDGPGVHEEEIVPAGGDDFTYAGFTNLRLSDGNYFVSVNANNELDMFSKKEQAEFVLLTEIPSVTGTSIASTWTPVNHELKTSWHGVFTAQYQLYYEVTVSWSDGGDGDIVQWEETKDNTLDISLNLEDVPEAGINVRVSVRAITPAGQFATAQTECFVSV